MKKITVYVLAFVLLVISSCDKSSEDVYMGTAVNGQAIPVDTRYSFAEGTYSTWVSFIDENSYNWSQTDVQGPMPTMTVPCLYNAETGEFTDTARAYNGDMEYGAAKFFPVSFCIDNAEKLYLFTFDTQRDTSLVFPRTIAEKTSGSAGNIEGTYKSSVKANNWLGTPEGSASTAIEAEVNYTFGAGTFNGTLTIRDILNSDIIVPEYDIEIGSLDVTHTESFSGTWVYNEVDNTITETILSPKLETNTYSLNWVSYNDKLYLVTSLTRFYQKSGSL